MEWFTILGQYPEILSAILPIVYLGSFRPYENLKQVAMRISPSSTLKNEAVRNTGAREEMESHRRQNGSQKLFPIGDNFAFNV
jgi:hypothetical protein